MSFEKICEAARNLNAEVLNDLLKENAYIEAPKDPGASSIFH